MLKRVITGLSALLLMTAPLSSAQAALLAKIEADVDGSGQKKTVELTGDKKIPGSNYYSDLWIFVKNAEGKILTVWKADLDGGYHCLLEKMPVNANAKKPADKTVKNDAKTEKVKANGKENTEKRFENLLKLLEEAGQGKTNGTRITGKPHDQILLMAAKGGKNAAVNCRILDFSDHRKARAVFSGADSLGVAVKAEYKPDNQFAVESALPGADGTKKPVRFSHRLFLCLMTD